MILEKRKTINNGFTLLEVMVAMTALAVSIYLISNLQIKSLKKVMRSVDKIDRIFFIKKELFNIYNDPPIKRKPIKKIIAKPNLTIISHREKINEKKSSLKDFAKNIEIVWSEGNWEKYGDKFHMKIISLITKPKPKAHKQEEKKKEKS